MNGLLNLPDATVNRVVMMGPRLELGPHMSRRLPLVVIETVGALYVYPVHTSRIIMEHRRAFGSRVALGQPFEGVVHHVVGV